MFSDMDRFICRVTCDGATIAYTGAPRAGTMIVVGRRMIAATTIMRQCFPIKVPVLLNWTGMAYKNRYHPFTSFSADENLTSGAGGGIRTHEGLRHRVLSPRQAIRSRLLPIRPGSGTPALQLLRQGRNRGRTKTTSRPDSPAFRSRTRRATSRSQPPKETRTKSPGSALIRIPGTAAKKIAQNTPESPV